MRPRRCSVCRELFTPAATGRPRRYCSDACRQKAYRKRRQPSTPGGRRLAAMFTSASEEWSTPQDLFDELDRSWRFDLDPCATPENAKCARFFTREDDGLAQEWTGRVFMNPPYGRPIGAWMRKAWEASQTTAELVVCLVPVRTGTRWWQDYAARDPAPNFLAGRLKFGGAVNSAPFDSAVVTFRNARSVTELAAFRHAESVTQPGEAAA